MKAIRRSVAALVIGSSLASSVACSLLVSVDGLQDGGIDASLDGSGYEASANDSGIIDASSSNHDAVATTDSSARAGAIAFVQVSAVDYDDGGTGTISLNPVVPGNTIIVALVLTGDASAAVTDDKGDSYTLVDGPFGQTNGKRASEAHSALQTTRFEVSLS